MQEEIGEGDFRANEVLFKCLLNAIRAENHASDGIHAVIITKKLSEAIELCDVHVQSVVLECLCGDVGGAEATNVPEYTSVRSESPRFHDSAIKRLRIPPKQNSQ